MKTMLAGAALLVAGVASASAAESAPPWAYPLNPPNAQPMASTSRFFVSRSVRSPR